MPGGTSLGAFMSRRVLAVIALVVVCSSLTACADSITAPRQPALASSTSQRDAISRSSCKSGYILSEGRCR
jgi:hypothetical protein